MTISAPESSEMDAATERRDDNAAYAEAAMTCRALERDSANHRYLMMFSAIVVIIAGVALWSLGLRSGDRFAAITRPGSTAWYQNLAGNYVTEIQDQDLFFHNIGRSIDHARHADIIILGSSLVSFGINDEVIHERLEKPFGLKFYNMAFVGVASGEFSRRIIEKYNLHPKLWIINADDGGGGGNFFGRNLTRAFGADVKEIPAVHYDRKRARHEVLRRDLRWRFERLGAVKWLFPAKAGVIPMFDRNDETGAADMKAFPRFLDTSNPSVAMKRDPDCHTTPDMIANARAFVQTLGAPVVFTLVPTLQGCLTQMREVAQATGVEIAEAGRTDYSSWDGGGHLDRNGSIAFTNDLVTALEKTSAFQALSGNDAHRQ